jgi:hypothetical protein
MPDTTKTERASELSGRNQAIETQHSGRTRQKLDLLLNPEFGRVGIPHVCVFSRWKVCEFYLFLCPMTTTKVKNVLDWLFDVLVQRRWPCSTAIFDRMCFSVSPIGYRVKSSLAHRSRKRGPLSSLTSDSLFIYLFIYSFIFPQKIFHFLGFFSFEKIMETFFFLV